MQSYFQFIKALSLKNNVSFQEQLMNPESKKLYKLAKPKKVRTKKLVKIIPKMEEISQEKPKGVKLDLSRAVVPVETVSTNQPINFYNQRWSNFVNSIPYESFRDFYTIDKKPKELKPYNLEKLRYLLYDVKHIIEHSPLSYELSSYCLSPYNSFPGKRSLKLYRNDKYLFSRKFPDINLNDTTFEFNHDFNFLANLSKQPMNLIQQVEELEKRRNFTSCNLIYLNDMMLSKRDLYNYIFLYGSFLTTCVNNKNKYLIVASSFDLGDGVDGFYKKLDKGYFSGSNFNWGINGVSQDFNFSKIANYMAGSSSDVPIAKIIPKTVSEYAPSEYQAVSQAFEPSPSNKQYLDKPLPKFNNATYPTLDKEFSQRIYFVKGALLSSKESYDPQLMTPIGSFVYYDNGYISQVISHERGSIKVGRFKEDKGKTFALPGIASKLQTVNITKGGRSISYYRPIRFIAPELATPDSDYTSLKNMAIDGNKTYREVYESLKPFFSDAVDDSNYRGDLNAFLEMDKKGNDFNKPTFSMVQMPEFNEPAPTETVNVPSESTSEVPIQLEEEEQVLEGGAEFLEEDLVTFLSIFNLKSCDVIGDIGNNQKAYLLSF